MIHGWIALICCTPAVTHERVRHIETEEVLRQKEHERNSTLFPSFHMTAFFF